ncbi:hypothetical protein OK016_21245 [Vibrio chagasii]|nr:hypothetical protein [Vibrio chagasii]
MAFKRSLKPESLQQLMNELGYPYFAAKVVDSAHIEDDYLPTSPVVVYFHVTRLKMSVKSPVRAYLPPLTCLVTIFIQPNTCSRHH